ncbi:MFS transporter [Methylocystis echinoides]|uniref:MFS transporter n=1 Tax=Methylocystis echinoides TaxID=29468 RepID=UPI0024936ACC|nr:MFS transporter [Methylocystis echinoides]
MACDHAASERFPLPDALPDASPDRQSAYRWFVLALATVAQVGGCFLVQGLGGLGPYLQAAFRLDAAEVGLAMSAAQMTPIVGFVVAGLLLDRFSERLIVGAGAIMVATALLAAARAEQYGDVLFWLFVASIGYCTIQPGGGKVVAAWFPAHARGLAMGIRQAGLPLGAALGALILPVAAARHGWRAAFDLGAVAALASGLLFAALYRQPPDPLPERRRAAGLWRERLTELAPRLPRIVLPGVTLVSVQFCVTVYLPLDLRDRFGIPVDTGVKLLFLAQFFGALGRVGLAAWSDRSPRGREFPLAVSTAAILAGLAAYIAAPGLPVWLVAVIAAWLGFFGYGWFGPWIALVTEAAPRGAVGFMLGFALAINQIVVVLTPPAFGALRDATGTYVYGWYVVAGAAAVALAQLSRRSAGGA